MFILYTRIIQFHSNVNLVVGVRAIKVSDVLHDATHATLLVFHNDPIANLNLAFHSRFVHASPVCSVSEDCCTV